MESGLSAGAVSRRLGIAVTTLRTWHQRYGLGPTGHAPGSHRRYTEDDLTRLEAMRRFTSEGVPAASLVVTVRKVRGCNTVSRSRGVAPLSWLLVLVADMGILLYGAVAVAFPSMMSAGYESYSGMSLHALRAADPDTAAYLLVVYRLVGGLNVALGAVLVSVAVIAFRRGERWAWWTVLVGNLFGYGVPMIYDQVVGEIGPVEALEFVAVAAVTVALVVSARAVWTRG